jgi:integrase
MTNERKVIQMADIKATGEASYLLTVSRGYDSNGKKIRKYKTINLSDISEKKREEEALNQWYLFKQSVENGTYIDAGKISFAEFVERWRTDYANKQLEPKTLYGYNSMLNQRIIPALGHIKLEKLQPTHLLSFYNNLTESGIRMDDKCSPKENCYELIKSCGLTLKEIIEKAKVSDKVIDKIRLGKNINRASAIQISEATKIKFDILFDVVSKPGGLSERSIQHHHRLISSILQDAVEWQIILSNPAARVKAPKVTQSEIHYYDEKQTKALIDALELEPIKYKTMTMLDIFTGLRCGELMGLEWSNIDLDNGTITINKASQYVSGKGTFTKSTKNKTSNRLISIPDFIVKLLKQYKSWQNEQILSCGDMWKKSNRLFTSWDGDPEFTYALTNWFPYFLKRHNLPKITPHGLRHTSATLLVAQGLDVTALSKRLGHARTSTTMDIYAHALQSSDKAAGTMLENLLIEKTDNDQKAN